MHPPVTRDLCVATVCKIRIFFLEMVQLVWQLLEVTVHFRDRSFLSPDSSRQSLSGPVTSPAPGVALIPAGSSIGDEWARGRPLRLWPHRPQAHRRPRESLRKVQIHLQTPTHVGPQPRPQSLRYCHPHPLVLLSGYKDKKAIVENILLFLNHRAGIPRTPKS